MRIAEAQPKESKLIPRPSSRAGITVHYYTSVYIKWNKVERRLGTIMEVHARSITLTFSQIDLVYTCSNPHPSQAQR
jgi:hypothetical protein